MQVGERIRYFRKNNGFTQKEFAGKLGYSQNFLSAIEIGKVEPSREFLKKLNEVFGISSDYILYGDPPDQTENILRNGSAEYSIEKKKPALFPEAELKYLSLPIATKKLIDNMVEILESDNEVMADLLKANIKGILEAVRMVQKTDENKSKGGD